MKSKSFFCGLFLCFLLLMGVAPVAAQTGGGAYIVQAGDTLSAVALRYGMSAQQLATANALNVNAWLYTGQRLTIPALTSQPAPTTGGSYTVRAGDTLLTIAWRLGVNVSQLAAANGLAWNSWVYVGQVLRLPGGAAATPAPPATQPAGAYVVKSGDNLFRIALNHGVSLDALRALNGLTSNTIYVGQKLTLPGSGAVMPPTAPPVAPPVAPPPGAPTTGGKWIDVNLSTQTVAAYEGDAQVYTARASTGVWSTPTVVGTFSIYAKYAATNMSGPGYNLPNVPYTMYFFRGYALHGTYWHSNFGTPMSHGCVNLATPDAEWFYNWAPIGTQVVSHY